MLFMLFWAPFLLIFAGVCSEFQGFVKVFRDFVQISTDFARILRNFARIFTKSKLLGVRLHPRFLHLWQEELHQTSSSPSTGGARWRRKRILKVYYFV